jgi:hypothetical protein
MAQVRLGLKEAFTELSFLLHCVSSSSDEDLLLW